MPQQLKISPAWSCLTAVQRGLHLYGKKTAPFNYMFGALLSSVQLYSRRAEQPEPEMQVCFQSPHLPAAQETQPRATQQEGTTRPPLIRCTGHLRHVNMVSPEQLLSASCIIHASVKWFLCVFWRLTLQAHFWSVAHWNLRALNASWLPPEGIKVQTESLFSTTPPKKTTLAPFL